MSRFQGGMIGSVANATSGTAYTGRANGVFPLPQQIVAKSSSLWAIGQTRPNPPTIGTATATGVTTISVAFIPPVQNGGSTITSYTVTSSGGQTATGSSSPIVVSGLTTGTSYTFTVTATNALGTSASSGTSNSVQPAITDPYFSSVSLLLNGDTLTDLSSSPKSITNNGSVTVNTSIKQFGTGSLRFNGTSSYLSIPYSDAFNFSSGTFTFECWIYQIANGGTGHYILDQRNFPTGTGFSINGGIPTLMYAGMNEARGTTAIPLNTWTHVAISVLNGTARIYIDGVQTFYGTGYTFPDVSGTSTPMWVGAPNSYGVFLNAYVDDLRITKGVARYTSNFTPPTAAFPTL